MAPETRLAVRRARGESDRQKVIDVLREVYLEEKGWVPDDCQLCPSSDLAGERAVWFLAEEAGRPVGVTRILFDLPRELYRAYGLEWHDRSFDIEAFLDASQVAEVGRFAVRREQRRSLSVAAALMRASAVEAVARECTHLITDVFENEVSSPYPFHTRVLGFRLIAHHDHGELLHEGRRLTLLLDIAEAIERLAAKGGWIYRHFALGWGDEALAAVRRRRAERQAARVAHEVVAAQTSGELAPMAQPA